MLRLWPERLFVGVFPDRAWLRRANGQELGSLSCEDGAGGTPAAMLDALLAQHKALHRANVELVVSDRFARIVHLPWQGSLTNDVQRTSYGRAYFERAGLDLKGEWLIEASFRHHGADGVAYALPRALVEQVRDVLTARECRLAAILPLSGAAYWRYGKGLDRKRSLILLEETRRVSAMLVEGRKYVGMQVQPCGTAHADAVRRLLNTLNATFADVRHVQYWSAEASQVTPELIKERLPNLTVEVLDLMRWH